MPVFTAHAPGTFCWPELGTTDHTAAKKFYTALFGWQSNDNDMGPMVTYTIFTRQGVDVASLYTLEPAMLEMGVPPHWEGYVSVESADDAAARTAAGFSASTFQFESGVYAVRLRNEQGELVMLPFQGQQIWSAEFGGRQLGMTSFFTEPRPTRVYLETYGGFLLHCGVTAMGVPSAQDSHPLHGELPNAPYQKAWVILGEDAGGEYIGLGGQYHHIVAFNHNYTAQPLVKLYRKSSLIQISLTIPNLKSSPMEWMYLAHINFRPVDYGRMVYSALPTPEHVPGAPVLERPAGDAHRRRVGPHHSHRDAPGLTGRTSPGTDAV